MKSMFYKLVCMCVCGGGEGGWCKIQKSFNFRRQWDIYGGAQERNLDSGITLRYKYVGNALLCKA